MWRAIAGAALAAVLAFCAVSAQAVDVPVAVAANFTDAANEIGRAFQQRTGHRPLFSFGATGALYTQITQGAPFQVFMSADQATAKRAVDENNAVAGTQFTYAFGKLVLFSKAANFASEAGLRAGNFQKIAIANPTAAPYGAAAMEVLRNLSVLTAVQPKIVQGDSITQTYQFIDTGNAELGFVAMSQVVAVTGGSRWMVPDNLYAPIRQDAVLTRAGANAVAARAFLDFLKAPEAIAVMEKYGYAKGM